MGVVDEGSVLDCKLAGESHELKFRRRKKGGLLMKTKMRERFESWFIKVYPELPFDGPTARGEWMTWQAAFMEGQIYQIEVELGKPSASDLDAVSEEIKITEATGEKP